MPEPTRVRLVLIVLNMLVAFFVSILANKIAETIKLSVPLLFILLPITLFLCATGLVEYEHYQHTRDIKQSLILRSTRWMLNKANERSYVIPSLLLEVCGVVAVSVAILITLALWTYDSKDIVEGIPSGELHNLVGLVGAYTGDFLFQRLSWFAFAIPLVISLFGLSFLKLGDPKRRTGNTANRRLL